jgi:hypothetical protein
MLTAVSAQESQEDRCDDAIGGRRGLPFIRYARDCKLFMMRRLRISGLLAFTKILGMDPQEAEELCHAAVAATKDKTLHSWAPQ